MPILGRMILQAIQAVNPEFEKNRKIPASRLARRCPLLDGDKLYPARLDEEALQILKEAESAINRRFDGADKEIYLIALNSS